MQPNPLSKSSGIMEHMMKASAVWVARSVRVNKPCKRITAERVLRRVFNHWVPPVSLTVLN